MTNEKYRHKRSTLDFSKHVVDSTLAEGLLVHHIHVPGTVVDSVKFINTNGIMAVTGDYGNWIFCREFHPSPDGYVSTGYWCEKLRIGSTQRDTEYNSEQCTKEVEEYRDDPEAEWDEEEKEWLETLLDASYNSEYEYIAAVMDRPSSIEAESIPDGRILNYWLAVVMDAFDEICRRIEAGTVPNLKW